MTRQKRPTIPRILAQMEQEGCNTREGLFTTLNNKFKCKPEYNKTIELLQFYKLGRHINGMQKNGWTDLVWQL